MSLDAAYRKIDGSGRQVVRRPAALAGRGLVPDRQHERAPTTTASTTSCTRRTCSPCRSRGRREPRIDLADVLQRTSSPRSRRRSRSASTRSATPARRRSTASRQPAQALENEASVANAMVAGHPGRRRDRACVLLPSRRRRLQLRRGPVLLRPVLRAVPRVRPADLRDPRQPRRHGLRRPARPAAGRDPDRVQAQLLRRQAGAVTRRRAAWCARRWISPASTSRSTRRSSRSSASTPTCWRARASSPARAAPTRRSPATQQLHFLAGRARAARPGAQGGRARGDHRLPPSARLGRRRARRRQRPRRRTSTTPSRAAGFWPDAVLSGHAHLYQRFTRRVDGREIPYIVAGSGGFSATQPIGGLPATPVTVGEYTLDKPPVVDFGYLTVTVDMTGRDHHLTIAFNDRTNTRDPRHHPPQPQDREDPRAMTRTGGSPRGSSGRSTTRSWSCSSRRRSAAAAWNTMRLFLLQRYGARGDIYPEGPLGAYRNFEGQVLCKKQFGTNAATPGRSNHGWGHAVDVAEHHMADLVDEHGGAFGWHHWDAKWEWWHREYDGGFHRPDPGPDQRNPILRKGSGGPGQDTHVATRPAAAEHAATTLGLDDDGDFGRDTDKAVRAFQRTAAYARTGSSMPATWHALGAAVPQPLLRSRRQAAGRSRSRRRRGCAASTSPTCGATSTSRKARRLRHLVRDRRASRTATFTTRATGPAGSRRCAKAVSPGSRTTSAASRRERQQPAQRHRRGGDGDQVRPRRRLGPKERPAARLRLRDAERPARREVRTPPPPVRRRVPGGPRPPPDRLHGARVLDGDPAAPDGRTTATVCSAARSGSRTGAWRIRVSSIRGATTGCSGSTRATARSPASRASATSTISAAARATSRA